MTFWSDNTAPAPPEMLEALQEANRGYAPAYGNDAWTAKLDAALSDLFERPVAVFPLITGTAANCLSIAQLAPPWGAVFAHRTAHLLEDESTAPELLGGGARLIGVGGTDGRLDPSALADLLEEIPAGFVHAPQPAVLAVTQATELGTVYSPDHLGTLAEIARGHSMRLIMDGARFANAVAHLGVSPAETSWRAGVDALAFGATKNGAFGAEALIFFDPDLAEAFAYRRKRSAHLLSKMRYVSAQLLAGLEQDRWLRWAAAANQRARQLADTLARLPGVRLALQPQTNAVFAHLPPGHARRLTDTGIGFYPWPSLGADAYRFVCSWCTQEADIGRLAACLQTAPATS